jgi:hypothetical protein
MFEDLITTEKQKPQPVPGNQVVPSRSVAESLNITEDYKHYPVTFSDEHRALFRKLIVCLSLIHARSVIVVRDLAKKETYSGEKFLKDQMRTSLHNKFLDDIPFDTFVRKEVHEDNWLFMLSIHIKLRYKIGDLAMTHHRAWEDMWEKTKEQYCFLDPCKWILDFVPIVKDVWRKGNYSRGDTEYSQCNLYKPLFWTDNYSNQAIKSQLPKGGSVCLYYLPNHQYVSFFSLFFSFLFLSILFSFLSPTHEYTRVVFQACLKKPTIMMALSLAARWRISIDTTSLVTADFPDCTYILSCMGDNYEDSDSEYSESDLE